MKRTVRIDADVLVVGGGTSGCMAAMAAAEEGADVVLLESDAALGGIATRGGIHRYYYGSTGGLQDEVDRRVEALGASLGGNPTGFHPEAKRIALSAMCAERGVRVLTEAIVYEAIVLDGALVGAKAVAPEGVLDVRARVTIDCTGNGSLVRMAGGAMRYGRTLDGVYHNYSLVPKRVKDGQLAYDNLDAGWVDPYDPADVSRAFLQGREWIWRSYAEGLTYFAVSPHLGLREGGRIEGESEIGIADYIEDRPAPDAIARSYSHLDNHGFDTGNESDFSQVWISVLGLFAKGLWCDIPYGCLLPKGLDRVLVGCRALSVDRDVSMGIRMQRDLHKTGEAAGVAAAWSVRLGCTPKTLNVGMLQHRLVERGVLQAEDIGRARSGNLRFRQGTLAGKTVSREEVGSYAAELVGYFDGEERWKAVWLLHAGLASSDAALDGVLRALRHPKTSFRLCAATVLAMGGRTEAAPALLELLRRRDSTKLSGHEKCMPAWVASLALLRMLGAAEAKDEALLALRESHPASVQAFVLTYLDGIAARLDAAGRREVAGAVRAWLREGGEAIGADYLMHGRRPESLRWSLELHAARVLRCCGDAGWAALRERWAADPRGFVRNAARRMLPGHGEAAAEASPVAAAEHALGAFDVAVVGGTAAGVVCAVGLARRGLRVALIEATGNLLVETTRARRTDWSLPGEAAEDGAAAELVRRLEAAGARRGDRTEPVLAQLVADRMVVDAGVRVWFEAFVVEATPSADGATTLRLAFKSSRGALAARRVVDAAQLGAGHEGGGSRNAVFTAMALDAPLDVERRLSVASGGTDYDVRLRPGFYEGETYLDVAFRGGGTGLGFDRLRDRERVVADVFAELRSSGALPERCYLAHLADEPWAVPASGGTPWEADAGAVGRLLLAGEAAAAAQSIFKP